MKRTVILVCAAFAILGDFPVEAAIVRITIEGSFEPGPLGSPQDDLNLDGAVFTGVYQYNTNAALVYVAEEEVFPSMEKFMLVNYWGLSSAFTISGRPNGATDVSHTYSPYFYLHNFYPGSTRADSLGIAAIGETFQIEGGARMVPSFSLDFFDGEFFPAMDIPLPPTFNNGDFEEPLWGYDDYLFLYSASVATVPVPAAVWLFGSALGLIGWMCGRAI
jgi:hypothetical protein